MCTLKVLKPLQKECNWCVINYAANTATVRSQTAAPFGYFYNVKFFSRFNAKQWLHNINLLKNPGILVTNYLDFRPGLYLLRVVPPHYQILYIYQRSGTTLN